MSPFGYGRGEGVDAGHGDPEWICSKEKPRYDELFQSLNPIDGKVTGAGTQLSDMRTLSLLLNTHTHLVLDKALEALLSATHNSSLITDLCMRLKDGDTDKHDDSFAKLIDSLSNSTENCKLITQFLVNAREAQVANFSGRESPAISIHSLNDNLTIDGAGDRCEPRHTRYKDNGFQTKTSEASNVHAEWNAEYDDSDTYSSSGSESQSAPRHNSNRNTGSSRSLLTAVKFVVLLSLNIVVLLITAELVFVSLVYVLTGERHIEFCVERAPRSWLDKAKLVTFGPDQHAVRIQSFAELFYRDNIVHILKYFTEKLTNSMPK